MPAFREHLLRLDGPSRRLRFGMAATDGFVKAYAERAYGLGGSMFGYFVRDILRGAAELRPMGPLMPRAAEAAFSVEAHFRDQGVGTELLGRVILKARNSSIKTIYMNCLPQNRAMQQVAQKHGADLRFDDGDVVGEVTAAHPTYFTLWREVMDDSHDFVMAVLSLDPGRRDAA